MNKKKSSQKTGSILIMIIIIMTTIMAIAYSMLSASYYSMLLAYERTKHEKQYQK